MITLIGGLAVLALVPVAGFGAAMLHGPGGYASLLVPRTWRRRWRGRKLREDQRSARISRKLRGRVLRADRRRCVACGSRDRLQVDHIVPWSLGGLTCIWNCATLCADDNRIKSNYWRSDSGKVYYRPFSNSASTSRAAAILAAERKARRNPLRLLRALA
jgi:5-methylcytosine-specific restriction endonuclease McrA